MRLSRRSLKEATLALDLYTASFDASGFDGRNAPKAETATGTRICNTELPRTVSLSGAAPPTLLITYLRLHHPDGFVLIW